MTPAERLAAIEERLKKATPGPWFNGSGEGRGGLSIVDDGRTEGLFSFECEDHDAEFIAHAPEDVSWLLERVRELEGKTPIFYRAGSGLTEEDLK